MGTLLLTRQLRRDPWVSVLLAIVVLVVTLLATSLPRLVLDMGTRQVGYVMDELSPMRRDVTGVATGVVHPVREGETVPHGAGPEAWGVAQQTLEETIRDAPEPLRSAARGGTVHVDITRPAAGRAPGGPYADLELTLRVDPGLTEHAELVRGQWPAPMTNHDAVGGFSLIGVDPSRELPDVGELQLIQVVILEEAAQELNWEVGESWGGVLLTGTYRVNDPDDPRWAHAVNGAEMGSTATQGALTATVAGYLAPDSTGAVDTAPQQFALRATLPLDVGAVRGDQVDELIAQLEQLSTSPARLLDPGPIGPTPDGLVVTLDSEALPTLLQLRAQQQASDSLVMVIAAGPLGVTLVVLLLGTRLIRSRRWPAVGLAVARGASGRQVRTVLAVEGLLVGLPAAAVGYLAAGWLLPSSTGLGELVVAGVLGLLPAAALVLTQARGEVREERRDLRSRTGSRVRGVAEAGLGVIAALAVWRLLERGLPGVGLGSEPPGDALDVAVDAAGATTQRASGPDPLLAATPVLVALVACVVTMRFYPVVVRLLLALTRRGRGLTGFLGAARALRDPAAGILPALSVILGVAIAVCSVAMASTARAGSEAAAWESAGAQIRASGPTMGQDERQVLRDLDGVAAVATAREIDRRADLTGDVSAREVRIVVIDDEMQQVSAAAGPLEPLPPALFEVREPAPVVTVGTLTAESGTARLRGFGQVEVLEHRPVLAGVRTRGSTLVMSVGNWEAVKSRVSSGNAVLVSLTGEVPAEQVAERVAQAQPTALIESPEVAAERFREAPITAGLLLAFLVAVAASAALTALAVLLAHFMGSVARSRMLSVLRTLGMPPGQARSLTIWEFGPLVAIALTVGTLAGGLVSWLLARAVDLTGLTGGAAQPRLTLDAALLVPVLGVVLVTMIATVALSAAVAGRADLAQQLRIGDER